jgi:hypothetical protein
LIVSLAHSTDFVSSQIMAPSWLKKNSLKNRDDQRTKAAELTLRQSIYPIVLVTLLFFLWVSGSITQSCDLMADEPDVHSMPVVVRI